jgi:2-iminobutanoate/2-iminopropanoate deaminase
MTHHSLDIIHTDSAPQAIGPYSQAIRVGDFVYTTGQIALDPVSGQIVAGGIEAHTRQVLNNLKNVLEAAGSGLHRVVKTTVYMQDLAEFAAMNVVYIEFFGDHRPARTTIQIAAVPRGSRVEIECVAVVG